MTAAINGFAQEAPLPPDQTCAEEQEVCKEALEAADTVIELLEGQSKVQGDMIIDLQAQVEQAERHALEMQQAKDKWYRSPFLYLGIGLVGGAVLAK
jgi:hypothetical protein